MSHIAKVHAQIRDWSRTTTAADGTITYTIMYRLLQSPNTSGVFPYTTVPITSSDALKADIQEALATALNMQPRDVFILGM